MESSDSESEDDNGVLITEDLDAEILATVSAIRSKDPKVYDENAKFYSDIKPKELTGDDAIKQKPMYLQDYHRKNLMEGNHQMDNEDERFNLPTYTQEQASLKNSVLEGIKRAGSPDEANQQNSDDDNFLVRKHQPHKANGIQRTNETVISDLNVEEADVDPETFLKNFMVSRAWTTEPRNLQPFESDEEEENRADAFEEAYNMRFEDPERANEKLISHSRDAAAKYSVRRNEPSSRQKTRTLQKQKREAERKDREKERHRLRNLKIEVMEEKIEKIKKSAGLHGKDISIDDWKDILEADWDDLKWDAEMRKRFDTSYYADNDCGRIVESDDETMKNKRQKVKKPKWDEDISIKDIATESTNEGTLTSTSENESSEMQREGQEKTYNQSRKGRAAARHEVKRAARLQRRFLEEIADASLENDPLLSSKFDTVKVKRPGRFRYRDTSPTSFGLSAHEILMAEDTQLNQHVGLKKLAAFRDPEKKRKDKEKLNKKSRLRKWRLETFGDKEGLKSEVAMPNTRAQRPLDQETKYEELHRYTNTENGSDSRKKSRRKKKKRQQQDVT